MVDLVADRTGVEAAEQVAAAVEAALVIVAMNGEVRVGSGSRAAGAAMNGEVRVVSGSRVVRAAMNVVASGVCRVVRVAMNGEVRVVMIEVRVAMNGEVRVVTGSRVARAAMNGVVHVVMIEVKTGEVRVVTGSRVVKVEMNVVARVVTTVVVRVVMTAVRDSVMIAMMRQSLRRSSVARRCSRVRAPASTAKTNRLPTAKIGMSVSSTRARFVASAFGVANPSARSAGRGGIEVARRSQHRPL